MTEQVLGLLAAAVAGGAAGGVASRFPRRRATPRPPGCTRCGASVGLGHTGYCPKSRMRGGPGGVVTEADTK